MSDSNVKVKVVASSGLANSSTSFFFGYSFFDAVDDDSDSYLSFVSSSSAPLLSPFLDSSGISSSVHRSLMYFSVYDVAAGTYGAPVPFVSTTDAARYFLRLMTDPKSFDSLDSKSFKHVYMFSYSADLPSIYIEEILCSYSYSLDDLYDLYFPELKPQSKSFKISDPVN